VPRRVWLVCVCLLGLVLLVSLSSVSAGWVESHDFGSGTIVTDMFVWRGTLYAMVHSYSGGGKVYFYRVTGVSGSSSTWELVWASDSPYAELENALVWDGIPFYSAGKKVFWVSSGYDQPVARVDREFSAYVSDIAVFKDYIYAVTVAGSLWRSAGYVLLLLIGILSPLGIIFSCPVLLVSGVRLMVSRFLGCVRVIFAILGRSRATSGLLL